MFNRLFLFIFCCFYINTAHAYVQFFYQPEKSQIVLTPSYQFSNTVSEMRDASGALRADQHLGQIEAEYGILNNLSVGLKGGYAFVDALDSTTSVRSRFSFDGLTAPSLNIKGFFTLSESFHLRYGIGGRYSEAQEFKNGRPSNVMLGRNEVDAYLGFDYQVSETTSLGFKFERATVIDVPKTKIDGESFTGARNGDSNTTSLFAEDQNESRVLGLSLNHTIFDGRDPRLFVGNLLPLTSLTEIKFYAVSKLSERIELLPTFSYGADFAESRLRRQGIRQAGLYNVGLGARFIF